MKHQLAAAVATMRCFCIAFNYYTALPKTSLCSVSAGSESVLTCQSFLPLSRRWFRDSETFARHLGWTHAVSPPKLLEVLEVGQAIFVAYTESFNIPSFFLAVTLNASLCSPTPEKALAECSEPGKSLHAFCTSDFLGSLAAIFCSLWAFPALWCLSTFL